jgi:hypothetical protein
MAMGKSKTPFLFTASAMDMTTQGDYANFPASPDGTEEPATPKHLVSLSHTLTASTQTTRPLSQTSNTEVTPEEPHTATHMD